MTQLSGLVASVAVCRSSSDLEDGGRGELELPDLQAPESEYADECDFLSPAHLKGFDNGER